LLAYAIGDDGVVVDPARQLVETRTLSVV